MVSSAIMELNQSRKELYQLMEKQSHTLLESIVIASQNSLLSNEYLEEISRKRLLNNANMIRSMFEESKVSNDLLKIISNQNDLSQIHIFNRTGALEYSSLKESLPPGYMDEFPLEELLPIFEGESDTLILGIRKAQDSEMSHYSVAVATVRRGAVVVNIDAQEYLEFRRNTGFGKMINNVASENKQVRFIAFQDDYGILAATGNITSLESIGSSHFLSTAFNDSLYLSRITNFDGEKVFEVTHPFSYKGDNIGLIRIGLSTAPLQEINQRVIRRMVVSTVVLVLIGFMVFTFLFIRQRLADVQKRYEVVETYSGNIINNVSDAILVYEKEGGFRIFNTAAESLFQMEREQALSKTADELFGEEGCRRILENNKAVQQLQCRIGGQKRYLMVSRSSFRDSGDLEYVILVVRDRTDQKQMEEQIQRQQRLTAMGKLASGVAHEIRNPLNAIGTIVQQLKKDFAPAENHEEYDELAGIVYGEVKRINNTIQEFLRFSRPEPVQVSRFEPGQLIDQLKKQYQPVLEEKKITLITQVTWTREVEWDENQIKQVLINLLQNAIDAIESEGRIEITLHGTGNSELLLTVSDDGPGMDQKTRENLFNLYYTTKASGIGIGLSMVQRIIYEHGGVISFESEEGEGTVFTLRLPVQVKQ